MIPANDSLVRRFDLIRCFFLFRISPVHYLAMRAFFCVASLVFFERGMAVNRAWGASHSRLGEDEVSYFHKYDSQGRRVGPALNERQIRSSRYSDVLRRAIKEGNPGLVESVYKLNQVKGLPVLNEHLGDSAIEDDNYALEQAIASLIEQRMRRSRHDGSSRHSTRRKQDLVESGEEYDTDKYLYYFNFVMPRLLEMDPSELESMLDMHHSLLAVSKSESRHAVAEDFHSLPESESSGSLASSVQQHGYRTAPPQSAAEYDYVSRGLTCSTALEDTMPYC